MEKRRLLKTVDLNLEICDKSLDKYLNELNAQDLNLANSFSWSDQYFQVAAEKLVLKQLKKVLSSESDSTYESIKAYVLSQVISMSRFPQRSSSQTSNLIYQYTLAAYAEYYSVLFGGEL